MISGLFQIQTNIGFRVFSNFFFSIVLRSINYILPGTILQGSFSMRRLFFYQSKYFSGTTKFPAAHERICLRATVKLFGNKNPIDFESCSIFLSATNDFRPVRRISFWKYSYATSTANTDTIHRRYSEFEYKTNEN